MTEEEREGGNPAVGCLASGIEWPGLVLLGTNDLVNQQAKREGFSLGTAQIWTASLPKWLLVSGQAGLG